MSQTSCYLRPSSKCQRNSATSAFDCPLLDLSDVVLDSQAGNNRKRPPLSFYAGNGASHCLNRDAQRTRGPYIWAATALLQEIQIGLFSQCSVLLELPSSDVPSANLESG